MGIIRSALKKKKKKKKYLIWIQPFSVYKNIYGGLICVKEASWVLGKLTDLDHSVIEE